MKNNKDDGITPAYLIQTTFESSFLPQRPTPSVPPEIACKEG